MSASIERRISQVPSPPVPSADGSERPAGGSRSPSDGRFARTLERLGHSLDEGESLMKRAVSGSGDLDARALIALQAGIYRYTEAVDLTAKLIDRAGTSVRTVMQSSGG